RGRRFYSVLEEQHPSLLFIFRCRCSCYLIDFFESSHFKSSSNASFTACISGSYTFTISTACDFPINNPPHDYKCYFSVTVDVKKFWTGKSEITKPLYFHMASAVSS